MRKKIMLILCILFVNLTICHAQENTNKTKNDQNTKCSEMIRKTTERMKRELSLTEEQANKIELLNREYLPKIRKKHKHIHHKKGNRTDSIYSQNKCKKNKCINNNECQKCDKKEICRKNLNKEEIKQKKAEIQKMRKTYYSKLNEILTPEQQEKYKSLRKKKKTDKQNKAFSNNQ